MNNMTDVCYNGPDIKRELQALECLQLSNPQRKGSFDMDFIYSGSHLVRKQRKRNVFSRFFDKIQVSEIMFFNDSPCWEWIGSKNASHYGQFHAMGEAYAHRVSYRLFIGEIEDGYEVDHLCRNRACCSPFHLESVTLQENRRRRSEAQTHCKNGHEFTEENTHLRPQGRTCKACRYNRRERDPDRAREIGREQKRKWRSDQRDAGRTGRF